MGLDKPMLVIMIVLYLFLASLACAHTFGTSAWNPGLDYDIQTHDVNFTTDVNLTDMGITVLEGEWHVVDGNLTSMVPGTNWFIVTDEIALSKGYPITKEYEIYGMSNLTRFTIFYGSRVTVLGPEMRHSYWEFDVSNNTLNCVSEKISLLLPGRTVHYSASYNFGSATDCTVKTYINKPRGLARTHVLTEVYIDNVKIASAEWYEWMASEILSCTGGVYTVQEGLKVHSIEGMKRVDVASDSAYSSISILLKLLLFTPPQDASGNYVVPLWLNIVLFKLPLFAIGVLILCIVRGV